MNAYRATIRFIKDRGDGVMVKIDIKYFKAETMIDGMFQAKVYAEQVSPNKKWKLLKFEEVKPEAE